MRYLLTTELSPELLRQRLDAAGFDFDVTDASAPPASGGRHVEVDVRSTGASPTLVARRMAAVPGISAALPVPDAD